MPASAGGNEETRMRTRLIRIATGLFALASVISAMPPAAWPQTVTPVAPVPASEAGTPQARLGEAELDQLLAPVALYPDQLLGQILMASTYPLEVVQANRWVRDPKNAALKGDALAAALEPIDWDPSVKSLVPFPQILAMMDQRLDWMQNLGDAFIARQDDVMESVQRLRRQAAAAGNLRSTPQQVVTPVGPDYVIQPANPTVVYVPVYDPAIVYGDWAYPLYPPFYFAPPPGFYTGPVIVHGVGFSIGFTIVRVFWGWDDWDWRRHRLHVDHDRYNVIDRYFIDHDRRPRLARDSWQHDTYHRRGVVYHDAAVQQRFRPAAPAPAIAPAQRRAWRGYDGTARAAAVQPAARPTARPADTVRRAAPAPREFAAPTPPTAPRAPQVAAPHPPVVQRLQPAAPTPAARAATQRPPERRPVVQRPVAQQKMPPAFQSFARGAEVRAESQRGRESRQTIAPAKPAPAASRPAAKPAERPKPPAHGGKDEPPADNKPRR